MNIVSQKQKIMTVEEKAKLYADWVIQAIGRKRIISSDRIANDFTAGYTQAVTDLSAENEKLREALRETSKELEQVFLDWYPYDNEKEIFRIGAIVEKAKQLITEEK